jgi:hypothetical protein
MKYSNGTVLFRLGIWKLRGITTGMEKGECPARKEEKMRYIHYNM